MTTLDPTWTIYIMDLDELTAHTATYRHVPPMGEDEGRAVTLPRDDYERLGKPAQVDLRITARTA